MTATTKRLNKLKEKNMAEKYSTGDIICTITTTTLLRTRLLQVYCLIHSSLITHQSWFLTTFTLLYKRRRSFMAFSSIWIERIDDGASISGLNQRFVPGESDGDPCPVVTVKPDVFVFGLWDRDCCFFTFIRQRHQEQDLSFPTQTNTTIQYHLFLWE